MVPLNLSLSTCHSPLVPFILDHKGPMHFLTTHNKCDSTAHLYICHSWYATLDTYHSWHVTLAMSLLTYDTLKPLRTRRTIFWIRSKKHCHSCYFQTFSLVTNSILRDLEELSLLKNWSAPLEDFEVKFKVLKLNIALTIIFLFCLPHNIVLRKICSSLQVLLN